MGFEQILEVGRVYGLPGLLLIFWYFDSRRQDDRLTKICEMFVAQQQMYKDNVELVKTTQTLAESQQTLIALNTEKLATVLTVVDTNQFCPMVRVEKRAKGPNS